MTLCSRSPLVAGAGILLLTGVVRAQVVPSCDQSCDASAASSAKICNEDLVGVRDFVPNEFDQSGNLLTEGTTGRRLCVPNLAVAAVLSRLDIDGDGVPDNAADTDGDGLPDNWESGGFEALDSNGNSVDRVVFYPAPSAIVPGTPPTPIFTRLAVATSALNPDTDGDGITDFVEVFGLMFVDENRDGVLENGLEWADLNGDGLPSPGEFPIDNTGSAFITEFSLRHDFDGFIFTDPINPDTDGDSFPDGDDNDPLINPRSFGNTDPIIVRFNAQGDDDVDQDGLGNGMDMGNDLVSTDGPGVLDFQVIDNPANLRELLELFRQDLLLQDVVPESAIEDLLGADWDGNGLWRTTDVRTWSVIIDPADPILTPPADLFTVDGRDLFAPQTFAKINALFNNDPSYDRYGGRGLGMGWQDLLAPTGRTAFLPDDRVWSILYSWRMPGFDIDGDGFIGVPNASNTLRSGNTVTIALQPGAGGRFEVRSNVAILLADVPFDDRIAIADPEVPDDEVRLDGQITVPGIRQWFACGGLGAPVIILMVLGLGFMRTPRRG